MLSDSPTGSISLYSRGGDRNSAMYGPRTSRSRGRLEFDELASLRMGNVDGIVVGLGDGDVDAICCLAASWTRGPPSVASVSITGIFITV